MFRLVNENPNGASNTQVRLECSSGPDGMTDCQGGVEAMAFRTWPVFG
jgi:hypothetical protein